MFRQTKTERIYHQLNCTIKTIKSTWCEELIHWKRSWCWETLRQKEKGQQRTRWLDGITNSVDMNLSKLWKIVKNRGAWHAAVHEVAKSWTQLTDWITAKEGNSLVIHRLGPQCFHCKGPRFDPWLKNSDPTSPAVWPKKKKKTSKNKQKQKSKDVTGNLSSQRETLPNRNTIYNTHSTQKKKQKKQCWKW